MTRLVLATALAVAIVASIGLRRMVAHLPPLPPTLYSTMTWSACRFGPPSCVPVFNPVPDGSFTGITCTFNHMINEAYCVRMDYTYWTEENCNRLTACPYYKPQRARDERGRH